MKTKSTGEPYDPSDEIAAWALKLQEAQQRLQELTGGEVDAVLSPSGQSYLLQDAQERLRQSEEQFRNMFIAAAVGIAISTPEGRFLHTNATYCRMLGYTEDELRELNFATLTHPDDLNLNLKLRDELLAGERDNFYMEKRYLKKNGEVVMTRHSVSATHTAEGEIATLMVIAEDITERKKGEESLALFRDLIDRSPDAIEVIDPDTGRFLDVNTTGCVRLGYSREEMLTMTLADIDVERDYQALWPVIVEEVKKAGSGNTIGRHRRKDGSTFPVEVNARYIELNRGYIVAVARDITERKQMEERFRLLVDSNVHGVLFWNRNGKITGGNDAFLHLIGYTREDLQAGRINWVALTPPEYAEVDQRALVEIDTQGFCTPYEKEYIRRDGSRVPILLGSAAFADNLNEGVCFVLDISERKRIESRFRRLVDSNAQGVMFWKATGEITDGNDAFLRLVGYTREDMQAGLLNWLTMTPPEYAEADQRAMEELAAKGICKSLEKEWIRKDGSRVPIYFGAATFEEGPNEGVSFMVDLTERKKLEQQFLRAQRMESIGTLAGGVAHDLNNILAPIMMSIDILKLKITDPQAKSILETIEVSSQRGADIVRQVLSFARGLEGQRIEVQPKHVLKDLQNITKDTFPKDIQLQFSTPNDIWTIMGDPTQVHQILLNLCVNARDAMPNGGNLNVIVENCMLDEQYSSMNLQAKPGRYVLISVTDSGMGIPPNIIEKIFDPFFTTKELNKGTGLGLSTVMALVKSHDGIINVYSVPGKGTTFKVYLPATEPTAEGRKEQSEQISMPRGNGETVLVIDDEASILVITCQTLEAFGYRVLTAKDGAEGVAVYAERKNEIAVVLTDMMMPIMDGNSVIRVLTRINPAIKIVAASGLSANASGNKVPGDKVKHFLTKPYTAETLLKALRAILDEM